MVLNSTAVITSRRVTLLNDPYLNDLNNLLWTTGQDNRGFQYQIALDVLPAGVTSDMIQQGQTWFVENTSTAYRLSLYVGEISVSTLNGVTVSGLPTSSGQVLTSTSVSGARWSAGGGGTTVSGYYPYLIVSGSQVTGELTAPDFKVTGLTGSNAVTSRWVGSTTTGAPTSGTFLLGDWIVDQTTTIWVCTTAGTPGTWWSTISSHAVLRSATATAGKNEVTIFSGSTASQTISAVGSPVDGATWTFINQGTVNVTAGFASNSMYPLGSGSSVTSYVIAPNSSYTFINYNGGNWYMTSTNDLDNGTGIVKVTNGGTGTSTAPAIGSIPLATSTSVYTPLAIGANGTVLTSNGTTATWAAASGGGGGSSLPAGTVIDFAGPSANIPTGYLICDGTSYSTTTYATLFSAIAYTWGGSGASFNVPDLRGKVTIGVSGSAYPLAALGGEFMHTLQSGETPLNVHTHTFTVPSSTGTTSTGTSSSVSLSIPGSTYTTGSTTTVAAAGTIGSGSTGSGTANISASTSVSLTDGGHTHGGPGGNNYMTRNTSGAFFTGTTTANMSQAGATASNTTGITASATTSASDSGHTHTLAGASFTVPSLTVNTATIPAMTVGGSVAVPGLAFTVAAQTGLATASNTAITTVSGHNNMQPYATVYKIIKT